MKFAQRLQEQELIHWQIVGKLIKAKEAQGVKTISLASGNPDMPTPTPIVAAGSEALRNPIFHRYPFSFHTKYDEAVASWYQSRFDVDLDPATEVHSLAGSQEGIANLGQAVMEPGAVALVPAPAYASYDRATRFAGGEVYLLPLIEENNYLPDLTAIPDKVLARTRLLWLNYPNNPTGAIAPLSFFEEAVAFAQQHDIIICHDNAYSDVSYEGYVAPSFLAVDGAKEVGIELNTLSKAFNMAGWRLGMAVGNPEVLSKLAIVNSNTSMGLFGPSQIAGVGRTQPGLPGTPGHCRGRLANHWPGTAAPQGNALYLGQAAAGLRRLTGILKISAGQNRSVAHIRNFLWPGRRGLCASLHHCTDERST